MTRDPQGTECTPDMLKVTRRAQTGSLAVTKERGMTLNTYPDRCGTHAPFDLKAGDRARRSLGEAEALAAKREVERGPQTVIAHSGWLLKGVWFVQDVRVPTEAVE